MEEYGRPCNRGVDTSGPHHTQNTFEERRGKRLAVKDTVVDLNLHFSFNKKDFDRNLYILNSNRTPCVL
jgi:hypothetical protein